MGHRHCLKHLVPRKTKPKHFFFLNSKTRGPPWESGVANRDRGWEREENQRSLSACSVTRALTAGTQGACRQRPEPRTGRLLKGKVECWLMDVLSYQSLPTSTTMAEVIDRFPE